MTSVTAARFALPDTSVSPLFGGWAAGDFDLPPAVTDSGRRLLELVDAERAAPRGSWFQRGDSLAERDAFDAAEDRHRLAARAALTALQRLEGLVAALGDVIVAECLRPAHTAALDAVRAVMADCAGVDLADPVAVARAGARAGAAYLVVAGAADRLAAITAARECIFARQRLGSSWRDPYGDERRGGALSDTTRWPERVIATTSTRVRVGPPHLLNRTRWLATEEGSGWCPTSSEWEAAVGAWLTDPARNGARPPGPVPMARAGYVSRPGVRRTAPLR